MNKREKLKVLAAEAETLRQKAATEDFSDADSARADQIVTEYKSLKAQIDREDQISIKLAGLGNTPAGKAFGGSPGAQFVASEAYQTFKANAPVSTGAPIDVRARLKTDPAPLNTGSLLGGKIPEWTDDLAPTLGPTLLDLITVGSTDTAYKDYRQVVSRTSAAKVVPEATATTGESGLKPISTLVTKAASAKLHTYADGIEITNQELSDDAGIQVLVDSLLRENVALEIERVVLDGDGADDTPVGIMHTTGVFQQDFATDMVTSVRKAMTKLKSIGTNITGLVLNPEDEEAWDLLKDDTGRFLGAGPFTSGPSTSWGVSRVPSPIIPVGTALLGDFRTVQLLTKDPLEIVAFNQHKDYAQRNLVYLRAEQRAMQLIRVPARLAVVDLAA